MAGAVRADASQRALIARYAASRGHLSQAAHFRDAYMPYGITANLLVRREAWERGRRLLRGAALGRRRRHLLAHPGRGLDARLPRARRGRAPPPRARCARCCARRRATAPAIAWMERRHPGSGPRPRPARGLARAAGGAVWLDGHAAARERAAVQAARRARDRRRRRRLPVRQRRAGPGRGTADADGQAVAGRTRRLVPRAARDLRRQRGAGAAGRRSPRARRGDARGASARTCSARPRTCEVDYLEDDGHRRARSPTLAWLLAPAPAALRARPRGPPALAPRGAVRPLRALAPLARRLRGGGERTCTCTSPPAAALDALRLRAPARASRSASPRTPTTSTPSPREPAREARARAAFVTPAATTRVRDLRAHAPPERATCTRS